MTNAGDLARRVAERRRELGLSEEQVADRAGMDPGYLRGLESSAAPLLSGSALLRLAAALETTVPELSGAAQLVPPGRRGPPGHPRLQVLSSEECHELIGPGGVGRIVYEEPRGPVALPVNFRMLHGDVVFLTSASTALVEAAIGDSVSFEVDHVDDALGEGWSVLLSGRAHRVVAPPELTEAEGLGIVPWAAEDRDTYVRLHPTEITGRRIRREPGAALR